MVPVLVVAYALDGQRRRRALERIGQLPMIARMTARGRRRAVAGARCCTVARRWRCWWWRWRGRRCREARQLTESRGLDLVVALDFSKIMLARDIYPSRLDRAKARARRASSTRSMAIAWGWWRSPARRMSYPLTVDYEAAKLFWRDLGPDDMPVGGTDLGRAIGASADLLKHARRPSRAAPERQAAAGAGDPAAHRR